VVMLTSTPLWMGPLAGVFLGQERGLPRAPLASNSSEPPSGSAIHPSTRAGSNSSAWGFNVRPQDAALATRLATSASNASSLAPQICASREGISSQAARFLGPRAPGMVRGDGLHEVGRPAEGRVDPDDVGLPGPFQDLLVGQPGRQPPDSSTPPEPFDQAATRVLRLSGEVDPQGDHAVHRPSEVAGVIGQSDSPLEAQNPPEALIRRAVHDAVEIRLRVGEERHVLVVVGVDDEGPRRRNGNRTSNPRSLI